MTRVFLGAALALSTIQVSSAVDDVRFEHHVVAEPAPHCVAVVTGFFSSEKMADVLLVFRDTDGIPQLAPYRFSDSGWETAAAIPLPADTLFVDVTLIGGRDTLIAGGESRLDAVDVHTGVARTLAHIDTGFDAAPAVRRYAGIEPQTPSHASDIPRVDVTRDLDGDGRDDLVVPAHDGFRIALQRADGSFADVVQLGPQEPWLDDHAFDDPRPYRAAGISALTVPWYLDRMHRADVDLDGRIDLLFWNGDRFDVHLQQPQGGFATDALAFTPPLSFDADGPYSLLFVFADSGSAALLIGWRERSHIRILHPLSDLDGDSLADITIQTLEGRSLLRQRSTYEIHYGRATDAGLAFDAAADTTVRPRGRAGALQVTGYSSRSVEDTDRDGWAELVFREVPLGLGAMARALAGKSVPLRFEVFRADGRTYADKPGFYRMNRRFAPFTARGHIFFPTVLIGDVHGDGVADLLQTVNPREVAIHAGVAGPQVFSPTGQRTPIVLPTDERNTWLTDLDRDGRADIVSLGLRRADDAHSVVTHFARPAAPNPQ